MLQLLQLLSLPFLLFSPQFSSCSFIHTKREGNNNVLLSDNTEQRQRVSSFTKGDLLRLEANLHLKGFTKLTPHPDLLVLKGPTFARTFEGRLEALHFVQDVIRYRICTPTVLNGLKAVVYDGAALLARLDPERFRFQVLRLDWNDAAAQFIRTNNVGGFISLRQASLLSRPTQGNNLFASAEEYSTGVAVLGKYFKQSRNVSHFWTLFSIHQPIVGLLIAVQCDLPWEILEDWMLSVSAEKFIDTVVELLTRDFGFLAPTSTAAVAADYSRRLARVIERARAFFIHSGFPQNLRQYYDKAFAALKLLCSHRFSTNVARKDSSNNYDTEMVERYLVFVLIRGGRFEQALQWIPRFAPPRLVDFIAKSGDMFCSFLAKRQPEWIKGNFDDGNALHWRQISANRDVFNAYYYGDDKEASIKAYWDKALSTGRVLLPSFVEPAEIGQLLVSLSDGNRAACFGQSFFHSEVSDERFIEVLKAFLEVCKRARSSVDAKVDVDVDVDVDANASFDANANDIYLPAHRVGALIQRNEFSLLQDLKQRWPFKVRVSFDLCNSDAEDYVAEHLLPALKAKWSTELAELFADELWSLVRCSRSPAVVVEGCGLLGADAQPLLQELMERQVRDHSDANELLLRLLQLRHYHFPQDSQYFLAELAWNLPQPPTGYLNEVLNELCK